MIGRAAQIESTRSFEVIDVIELKATYNLGVVPGVVLVLRDFRFEEPDLLVGRLVLARNPAGNHWLAEVEGVRDHGTTLSIHLGGLSPREVPVGSVVHFPTLTSPTAERFRQSPV